MGVLGKMQWAAAAQLLGCSPRGLPEHHPQGMGRQRGTAAAPRGCLCRAPLPTLPVWGQGTSLHLRLFSLHGLRTRTAFRNAAEGGAGTLLWVQGGTQACQPCPTLHLKCPSDFLLHTVTLSTVFPSSSQHHRRQDLNQMLRNQLSGAPELLCSCRHLEPETSNCGLETEVQRREEWGHCSAQSPNGKGQILSRSEW